VERRDAALFVPPMRLRSARPLEHGARRLLPPAMAGLTITEAAKDMYAAVPIQARPQHRITLAEAA